MRNSMVILFVVICVLAGGITCADELRQKAVKLDAQIPVTINYLLYLPTDFEKKDSWPLVLFLHGAGERGDDLEKVKVHGPPKLIEEGKSFPFVVISPQCREGRTWEPVELTALVDDAVAKYKIDKDRIYVTGLSMGGFGTWALASYSANRFAAIIPICGGGDTVYAHRLARLPIWVFHGAKDSAVSLKRSEDMVEAVKKNDGNVKFTIYPDAGHDSWTATYDNPEVYEWMLQQTRKPKGKEGK